MVTTTSNDIANLSIAVLRDADEIDALEPQWNALVRDVPFRTWQWAASWWRHYRKRNDELFTLAVLDRDRQLIGLAPWYLERSASGGRAVRFLGSGEVCSDYLTILCRDGFEAPVAHRLADWLATDAAGEWHLLDLGGVEESDATIRQFAERFEQHGHIVDTRAESNCWRTGLPSDWQQFLAGLTSSRRARTRALLRAAFENGPAVLHAVESPADLEHAFPILIDLHQKRRRSLSQPGCFASPRFTAFHREVAGRLLAAGHLRLMWTEWDSRPMSVDYGFVGGDTVYYYQGGFDPDLSAHSPGWLSNAVSLKRAIEQGYRSYDFLRGDESYKSSWQASVRPLVRLRIVGSQATARARYATWRGSETLKSWTRQVLSRTKG